MGAVVHLLVLSMAVIAVSGNCNLPPESRIGPCDCGFTLDKGCFLSAPKPGFIACQCHLTGSIKSNSTSCYGCLVQCSHPMLQTCANNGDTKADCLQGVKNSIGNCNGYTNASNNEVETMVAVLAVSGAPQAKDNSEGCYYDDCRGTGCSCGFTLNKGCFLSSPKPSLIACQCRLTGSIYNVGTRCDGRLVYCNNTMTKACATQGDREVDCLQGVKNGIGNCNGYTNGNNNEVETIVAVLAVSGAPQANDNSEGCYYDGCRGTGCSCGFTLNKGCFLSSPKPSLIACQCRLSGSIYNGGTRCDGRLVYCNNTMSTACAAQGDTKVDCLQGVKNGIGNCNGYTNGSNNEPETMVAVPAVSGTPQAKDNNEGCYYGRIGPCDCGFTLGKGCFLSAPKPRFIACQCHLNGSIKSNSTSCYGCLVQCSNPMLQTCANNGDTKADCLEGVKNSFGNCNGYINGSNIEVTQTHESRNSSTPILALILSSTETQDKNTTRFFGQGNLAGGPLGALNQVSQIISGAFGGVSAFGSSSSCRRWCLIPQGQGYCCEGGDGSLSAAVTKQGLCPPDRTSCPPTLGFAPHRCSNDGGCAEFDKCCFDTCLQYYNCKPPFGPWK